MSTNPEMATSTGNGGAATLIVKSLDQPDEARSTMDRGRIEMVTLGGVTVARATFEPGWRWSEHVKPLAGTELWRRITSDTWSRADRSSGWLTEPKSR